MNSLQAGELVRKSSGTNSFTDRCKRLKDRYPVIVHYFVYLDQICNEIVVYQLRSNGATMLQDLQLHLLSSSSSES